MTTSLGLNVYDVSMLLERLVEIKFEIESRLHCIDIYADCIMHISAELTRISYISLEGTEEMAEKRMFYSKCQNFTLDKRTLNVVVF